MLTSRRSENANFVFIWFVYHFIYNKYFIMVNYWGVRFVPITYTSCTQHVYLNFDKMICADRFSWLSLTASGLVGGIHVRACLPVMTCSYVNNLCETVWVQTLLDHIAGWIHWGIGQRVLWVVSLVDRHSWQFVILQRILDMAISAKLSLTNKNYRCGNIDLTTITTYTYALNWTNDKYKSTGYLCQNLIIDR